MITNKEPQLMEPKVFALLVEFNDVNFISVQSAFSLEEAFFLAELEFENIQKQIMGAGGVKPENDMAKISLFSSKTIKELNDTLEVFSKPKEEDFRNTIKVIKKEEEKTLKKKKEKEKENKKKKDKNKIMKEIIDSKNKEKLEKNKHLLNKREIKFIEYNLK